MQKRSMTVYECVCNWCCKMSIGLMELPSLLYSIIFHSSGWALSRWRPSQIRRTPSGSYWSTACRGETLWSSTTTGWKWRTWSWEGSSSASLQSKHMHAHDGLLRRSTCKHCVACCVHAAVCACLYKPVGSLKGNPRAGLVITLEKEQNRLTDFILKSTYKSFTGCLIVVSDCWRANITQRQRTFSVSA